MAYINNHRLQPVVSQRMLFRGFNPIYNTRGIITTASRKFETFGKIRPWHKLSNLSSYGIVRFPLFCSKKPEIRPGIRLFVAAVPRGLTAAAHASLLSLALPHQKGFSRPARSLRLLRGFFAHRCWEGLPTDWKGKQDEAEAESAEAARRRVVVAVRSAAVLRAVEPTAAATHAVAARSRPRWI